LGIPAIASPVGVNKQIIDEGKNGFIAVTEEDWYNKLSALINDVILRTQLGEWGKEKIKAHYSIQANTGSFLALFT
jgi:glycosyltransferase involved in cell wall biosynthesis